MDGTESEFVSSERACTQVQIAFSTARRQDSTSTGPCASIASSPRCAVPEGTGRRRSERPTPPQCSIHGVDAAHVNIEFHKGPIAS
ncbi:hypothetical protein AB395_00002379 [Sinorhizobium fredii CCBAU 45436]|nr:hypothetical protein AB395_00002379 [Sinorhizobium fredii CCBAU 45436]